jgi:hypothetical protein
VIKPEVTNTYEVVKNKKTRIFIYTVGPGQRNSSFALVLQIAPRLSHGWRYACRRSSHRRTRSARHYIFSRNCSDMQCASPHFVPVRCGRVGWTAGRLPSTLYLHTYFTVHRSSDRFFVSYIHMTNYHLLIPEPPPPTQPVNRALQRGHATTKHHPPLAHISSFIEPFRVAPVLHAHTAHSLFLPTFLFHSYTTLRDLFAHFLTHPYTTYSGRPIHLAVLPAKNSVIPRRESLISPQNVDVDYLYLFRAGAVKSPIFGAETPKPPINKGRD